MAQPLNPLAHCSRPSAADFYRELRTGLCVQKNMKRCLNTAAVLLLILSFNVFAAEPVPPAAPAAKTDADYAAHIEELKKKLPRDGAGFTFVIVKPFVVVGDEAAPIVKRRADETVKWSLDRLKAAYFEKDPEPFLDIYLFRDATSYQKNAQLLFGEKPDTPYGYFSSRDHALVMNISTGGGTLVHELVHSFVDVNFPACPSWFNEGLASLYEQSGDRNGKIVGMTNWRLPILQKVIRAKNLATFEKLTATTRDEFYRDKGAYYPQARYLCYYLQEKGLLQKFYKQFAADHEKDPTGYATLKAVLGRDDMDAFNREWQEWALTLHFP